jgi:ElaB/YqjD/DUF883 family membrane-anchored ribosome-binding protein
MARVYSAKAAKDYPQHGIEKGDQYYYWFPYMGRKQFSKSRPTPSQVESNETRANYLLLQEEALAALDEANILDDIMSALDEASSRASETADELREKASNIEDGFGHETEMSMQFNEQADEVESWGNDLTNLDRPDDPNEQEEPEEPSRGDFPDGEIGDEKYQGHMQNYEAAKAEWQEAIDNWEQVFDDVRQEAQDLVENAPEI